MIELNRIPELGAPRAATLASAWKKLLGRQEIGFPRLSERDEDWKAIAARAAAVGPVARVIVVGIGGSSLGTQVIYEAFRHQSSCEVLFLESPDPHTWQGLATIKDWSTTHLIVISKSGNTLETLSITEKLAARVPQLFNLRQVTVIASPGEGPLQKWAKAQGYATLWIPADVGGRFSVLTAVGMFPAALMGLDVSEFRAGAAEALRATEQMSSLSEAVLKSWDEGCNFSQMWVYSENLKVFGEWWTQLWSESLGKKLKRDGREAPRASAPLACRGPRDQHSLVQQLIEGPKDKYVFVVRVRATEKEGDTFLPRLFPDMPFAGGNVSLGQVLASEAEAFERSLAEVGIPSSTTTLDRVNERSLGRFFMLWQMVIAQLGEALEINAFDQPGVELGKKYAQAILRQPRA